MKELKELCEKNPNDADLGKEVRALVEKKKDDYINAVAGIVFIAACFSFIDAILEITAIGKSKKKHRKNHK
jgi:hypothetical protein